MTPRSPRGRIERDLDDRMIAGVAGGVAARIGVSPWLVRLGLVFLTFFGALGFVLYVAGWLLIPEQGSRESLAEEWFHGRGESSWGGAAVIGLVVLIALTSLDIIDGALALAVAMLVFGVLLYRGSFDPGADRLRPEDDLDPGPVPDFGEGLEPDVPDPHVAPVAAPAAPADPIDPGVPQGRTPTDFESTPRRRRRKREKSRLGLLTFGLVLMGVAGTTILGVATSLDLAVVDHIAVATVIVGAGLLVGTFFGRSRGLIVLGLALIVTLQAVSWFDVPLEGGFGDPEYTPGSITSVRPEYRLTGGELTVDLSRIEIPPGEEVHTSASVAAGQLNIVVPEDAGVDITARVIGGEIDAELGDRPGEPGTQVISGPDLDFSYGRSTETSGVLYIEVEVGFGQLVLEER